MAQSDQNLVFSSAQAISSGAGSVASTNFLDLATGTAIANSPGTFTAYTALPLVWGQATYFGEDLGIGVEKMPIAIYLGVAAFTGSGDTLNIQIQGAVDSGGTTYGGLTWATYDESGTIALSLLTANAKVYSPWFPHRKIAASGTNGSLPRFLQLNYLIAGGSTLAGTIQFAGFVQTRDDNDVGNYGSGFTVGA